MIHVCDISSINVQHEQFNKAFLNLLLATYLGEKIHFFGDTKHIKLVQTGNDGVVFHEVEIYSKRGGIKEFIRAIHQYRLLKRVLKLAEECNSERVYVLLIHPFAHFLLKTFSKANLPVILIMHGELESVKFNKHFLNKIWGIFQKFALTRIRANIEYIILGRSIYDNLVKTLPKFSEQKATIMDHPYPFSKQPVKKSPGFPLVFSSLGVATKGKNTHYFFQLAESCFNKGLNYRFNICGRVYKDMEAFLNVHVNYKQGFLPLTRIELELLMKDSHFSVFYHENSDYSLCSSGSFWDAINAEVPLLYVHNDYFDYYAEKVGPIGIPFSYPIELNNYVLSLTSKDVVQSTEYVLYVRNIRKLKYELMSEKMLSRQLLSGIG